MAWRFSKRVERVYWSWEVISRIVISIIVAVVWWSLWMRVHTSLYKTAAVERRRLSTPAPLVDNIVRATLGWAGTRGSRYWANTTTKNNKKIIDRRRAAILNSEFDSNIITNVIAIRAQPQTTATAAYSNEEEIIGFRRL